MAEIALRMSEHEFIAAITDVVKAVDAGAMVIPTAAAISTRTTAIKRFTVSVVTQTELSEAMFEALDAYVFDKRKVVEYRGWVMSMEDKTFKTVVHTIEAKLHKRGC